MDVKTVVIWVGLVGSGFAVGWLAKPVPDPDVAGDPGAGAGGTVISVSDAAAGGRAGGARTAAVGEGNEGAAATVRAGRGLGVAAIRELGEKFKGELDPIKRRAIFSQMLEGLTVDNAKDLREQIAHLPAGSQEFRDFHYAWGKIGGVDAILHGADTPKPDMAATLAGWASADPRQALAWFEGLDGEQKEGFANQAYLKMGLLHGLSDVDTGMATELMLKYAEAGDRQAHEMLGVVTGKALRGMGTEGAAAWATSLPEGKMRDSAMGRVAHHFAGQNPEEAAQWAESLGGGAETGKVVGAVAHQWGQKDGAAAVGWLATLEPTKETSRAFYTAFEGWAGRDPAAASDYLVSMPAGDGKDYAISGLVSRHRWEDPRAAIAWAGEIGHEKGRNEATIRAGQAFYRKDQVGAIEWMAESGLPAEALERIARGK